jgi:hypothetical protein
MDRPAYEETNERTREMDAIKKILNPNDTVKRLPARYGISFMTFRNDIPHSWVESKLIDIAKGETNTFTIGVAKIVHGIRLSERTGIPFTLVIEWKDIIGTLRVFNTDIMKMQWENDEPVYHIPSAHLATRFMKNNRY